MGITNGSFEDAGAGQGLADGWTLSATGAAQGIGHFEAGDGFFYATEDFSGWVSGQAEYRLEGFSDGDTTAGLVEPFSAWVSGLEDYRAAFLDSDCSAGAVESFGAWTSALADYRFAGFDPGDTSAATVEDFDAWTAAFADYRAAFDPGDTTAPTFQEGASTTRSVETFEACRSDVAVQTTASSTTIAAAGHGFSVSDPVRLLSASPLPAPFQKGITYYVKTISAGVSLTLAATDGGSAITATETGEATLIGDEGYFWRNPKSGW